jgi:EGF-like domain
MKRVCKTEFFLHFFLFSGTDCEHNIDECADSPCLKQATCLDGINNYTCACQPGYTGRNCQVDIDDFALLPCLNGSQCLDVGSI